MRLSVVTPVYEAHGQVLRFLRDLSASLVLQETRDFEWVVSDHSKDDTVKNFLQNQAFPFKVSYLKNEIGRGNASINMNTGILHATGDVIKVMHMDDMFVSASAIGDIATALESNPKAKWGGMTFDHLYEENGVPEVRRVICPSMEDTMGCPSVSFFANENNFFDEHLIVINDHDMHQRLFRKYGPPLVIDKLSVRIRMHPVSVSNTLAKDRVATEWQYFNAKIQLLPTY
jgi:glycosyltransferase involved in cell wall biosynthesis